MVVEVVAFGRYRGVTMAALDSDVESLPRGAFRCCLCHITTANRKRWLMRGWVVVGFRLWILAKLGLQVLFLVKWVGGITHLRFHPACPKGLESGGRSITLHPSFPVSEIYTTKASLFPL